MECRGWEYMACTCKCYHEMGLYVQEPLAGGKWTTSLFESWFHCFVVACRVNMEQRVQYILFIETFKVVPEVVCSLLPLMGKVADTINSTWHAILNWTVVKMFSICFYVCKLFLVQWLLQFGSQIIVLWTEVRRIMRVL